MRRSTPCGRRWTSHSDHLAGTAGVDGEHVVRPGSGAHQRSRRHDVAGRPQGSGDREKRLHGKWLNRNLAYRMVPSSNRDTASLDLWIPLPKKRGSYFVRSTLTLDGVAIASADSDTFR